MRREGPQRFPEKGREEGDGSADPQLLHDARPSQGHTEQVWQEPCSKLFQSISQTSSSPMEREQRGVLSRDKGSGAQGWSRAMRGPEVVLCG